MFKNPLAEEGQHERDWIQLWLWTCFELQMQLAAKPEADAFKAELKSQMKDRFCLLAAPV